MFDFALDWIIIVWGVTAVLVGFVLTTAVTILAVVRLPATFFQESHSQAMFRSRHPAMRWTWLVGKNLIGYPVIMLGALLALPGVPGPGVLLILIGIVLIDFPGKRPTMTRLLSSAKVLRCINRLRERFSQPPVVPDTNNASLKRAR
jgi:hypothetical protein